MEEHEKESDKLTIPAQTSDRKDYIQGIGAKEVTIIVIALFAGIIFTGIALFSGGNVVGTLFFVIFAVAVTILLVRRDTINESVIDKIRIAIAYGKSQKKFYYKYYDFIEEAQGENEQ